ncbi:P-loop containing nucleoside triphosphate hydrolase protein, partial [Panus rudis PR-1116 ss-1]
MTDLVEECWSSPDGKKYLTELLKQLIPQWENGPHDWQVDTTACLLDGDDQLLIAACGEGKTAAAYLHLIVRHALARDPKLKRFGTRMVDNPLAIMVGPLVDLGISQVEEMERLGIHAVALDAESIRKAKEQGVDVYKKVEDGETPMVILSPERLTEARFDRLLRDKKLRENIVAYIIDEAHVVVPWGIHFRKDYAEICRTRHRIPASTPMLAMTATSRSGAMENAMKRVLGLRKDYVVTRRSCERTNVQTIYQTLTHGLDGSDFPDIAWVAAHEDKKTIVYCKTIDQCYRVASYLRRLRPPGEERFQSICTYHSLLWPSTNAETLRKFREDPRTFIVVATIKFGMGIDVRRVTYVVTLGLPESIEQDHQQRGRAMRDPRGVGIGITYCEKSVVAAITR